MFSVVGTCNSTEASMTKDIVSCLSNCRNMKNNVSLGENKTCPIANQGGEGCMMTDPEWFKSNINIRNYVPIYLHWLINSNEVNASSTLCKFHYQNSFTSQCECRDGFQGNPYLECLGKYHFLM
ncbi:hypothetical protein NC651_040452 [Populus alba x Populus x berolinensis]|nr:hypothetical protein NC651_040452 [Populus alba x Populus x berolinensis]